MPSVLRRKTGAPLSGLAPLAAALVTVCALLALAGCAHVEPPSGGPEDKTPPAVAAVYPAPNAVNVPRDANVVFQFDEWIDRNAVRGQVLLSPPLPGRLRAEADGDRLIARPSSGATLRAGTTYTVVAMGGLKDLHGNALSQPFPLRFSTGPALDSASISGHVVSPARRGSLVVALYRADDRSRAEALSLRDTAFSPTELPEPWRELPAYLAATDSLGAFVADGAAPGVYALFAFDDVNGNLAFDVGLEPAAVGESRITLSSWGGAPAQALYLAALDTLPLRIAEAAFETYAADSAAGTVQGLVSVKFTRDPHPARAAEAARYFVLPENGAPAAAIEAAWSPERGAWLLAVPALKAGAPYRILLRGRPDFPGREGLTETDTSAAFTPEVPDKKDGIKAPEWKVSPLAPPGASGLARIGSLRAGAAQNFSSSVPLSRTRWEALAARLEALIGKDTVPVALRPRRTGLLSFAVDLPRPLRASDRLELNLRAAPGTADSSARTLYAGSVPDTNALGVLNLPIPANRQDWTFWAVPIKGDSAQEIPLERAGGNLKASAPPGVYRVQAFLDRDRDGVRDPGSLRPWIAQEPFAVIADTVRVSTKGEMMNEK